MLWVILWKLALNAAISNLLVYSLAILMTASMDSGPTLRKKDFFRGRGDDAG